jgi:hypothetical protein
MASKRDKVVNHQEHLKKLVANSKHGFTHIKELLDYIINFKDS